MGKELNQGLGNSRADVLCNIFHAKDAKAMQ